MSGGVETAQMPQLVLPVFAEGATPITSELSFAKRDGRVTYFHGLLPVFAHAADDLASFRLITSQFIVNGSAEQSDIVCAFGVPASTVKRYVRLFRECGTAGFFAPRAHRGPAVLTATVVAQVQQMMDAGADVPSVAEQVGIKRNTLHKAVRAGRLHVAKPTTAEGSTKSHRSEVDSRAPMGVGATNTTARMLASIGKATEVPIAFAPAVDVVHGGVLLSLPALLSVGLLSHTKKHFELPAGFYGIASIFLLLGWMTLCRVKQPESLRYSAPGEWGKLLGLDRVPEVRTLREKIALLSNGKEGKGEDVSKWSAALCEDWMGTSAEAAGVMLVDGHVRVYHGSQTKLPRHHVARERLCLRATTDYWVSALDGQPFFIVNKPVDPGMQQVLSEDIIPRLLDDVPGQPTQQELEANPLLHRFTLVFDREGYSPDFFFKCRKKRIAILTYHKHPDADWPAEDFTEQSVKYASGEQVTVRLAERGTRLSNGLWVREFRKLTESGHQTAILSSDYGSGAAQQAGRMLSRWGQENFFRYARQHFNLDRLIDYGTEVLPETTRVVNPAWRELDTQLRSRAAILSRKLAQFGACELRGDIEPSAVAAFERQKAKLLQEVSELQLQVDQLKASRKQSPRHIEAKQLPKEHQFEQLRTRSKDFIDTIKMIAYRAETAMAAILRDKMSRSDDARALLRQIYGTEADILPDAQAGTLTVRLHHMANPSADAVVRHLCAELNSTATVFPGTQLRLVYQLGSEQNPRDQEV